MWFLFRTTFFYFEDSSGTFNLKQIPRRNEDIACCHRCRRFDTQTVTMSFALNSWPITPFEQQIISQSSHQHVYRMASVPTIYNLVTSLPTCWWLYCVIVVIIHYTQETATTTYMYYEPLLVYYQGLGFLLLGQNWNQMPVPEGKE